MMVVGTFVFSLLHLAPGDPRRHHCRGLRAARGYRTHSALPGLGSAHVPAIRRVGRQHAAGRLRYVHLHPATGDGTDRTAHRTQSDPGHDLHALCHHRCHSNGRRRGLAGRKLDGPDRHGIGRLWLFLSSVLAGFGDDLRVLGQAGMAAGAGVPRPTRLGSCRLSAISCCPRFRSGSS
jgi:hypothetical protein